MQQYKIDVDVSDLIDSKLADVVSEAAGTALEVCEARDNLSVNILITDDSYLRGLNKQFLGFDQATDVLAFPMYEMTEGLQDHLGDIAISYDTALQQAKEAGHTVYSEIQLLVVHGILHLMGYDHDSDQSKQEMWQLQATALALINSEIQYPLTG